MGGGRIFERLRYVTVGSVIEHVQLFLHVLSSSQIIISKYGAEYCTTVFSSFPSTNWSLAGAFGSCNVLLSHVFTGVLRASIVPDIYPSSNMVSISHVSN